MAKHAEFWRWRLINKLADSKYLPYSHGGLKLNSKEDETRERSSSIGSNGPSSNDSPRGSLGSGPLDLYSSRDCLYPEDMMPFLRNPMVIIADSDNASSFLVSFNLQLVD